MPQSSGKSTIFPVKLNVGLIDISARSATNGLLRRWSGAVKSIHSFLNLNLG
jgi:hypothetical protein